MPYVISKLCDGCKSTACVPVCPVDCIYGLDKEKNTGQLYINPDECIDCGACEPECPFDAIFEDGNIPLVFREDVERNANFFRIHTKSELTHKPDPINPNPTLAEISENKKKYA